MNYSLLILDGSKPVRSFQETETTSRRTTGEHVVTVLKNVPFGNGLEKRHVLILVQVLFQVPKRNSCKSSQTSRAGRTNLRRTSPTLPLWIMTPTTGATEDITSTGWKWQPGHPIKWQLPPLRCSTRLHMCPHDIS